MAWRPWNLGISLKCGFLPQAPALEIAHFAPRPLSASESWGLLRISLPLEETHSHGVIFNHHPHCISWETQGQPSPKSLPQLLSLWESRKQLVPMSAVPNGWGLSPRFPIPKPLPQGPGLVTYLERVQVAESTQERRPGRAGHLLSKRAGEVGYVAGGQHQHVQLGQLGVGRHSRQGGLQGQEGLAQRPHPAPLPCSVLRTGLTLHRGPRWVDLTRLPSPLGAKCILGQGLLPE